MKKIEIKRDVERYLEKNLSIEEDIIDKIKKCLGEYLVVNINSCNKHELKGNCKGFWRLQIWGSRGARKPPALAVGMNCTPWSVHFHPARDTL
ncbi:type II toxin-antitoxin system RelE family toxin [Methanoculleus sp.]|uniref:type II toxin-antitoxin system RelE family toxin n=1 Tax=Methanoculleus sp. TaxID=90427 RepID=UPI002FCC2A23